ncbi:aminoglycoside phosphotransferase family protein [Leifsonia poae]|uniref:aminoglycoside phosphotransferase family protein n=1 Tax=Leifsonia poae TaxID=110933 RepID=UPI001CBAEEC9|nr:aminoglycoside phosphotransferase family protein [Leifsonia poae]
MIDLDPYRASFGLTEDGEAFTTPSSVLQPVRLAGRPAFLKVATVAEEAAGGRVMRWWAGRGAAAVLAVDGDALVLARATGLRELAGLSRSGAEGDDEATRILCRAARRLHAVTDRPLPEGLVTLPIWFRDLFDRAREHPDARGGILKRAAAIAVALLADPVDEVVLHGDLHHGNVLDFGRDGWLAIDPKHLIGDSGFDYANILCNPSASLALAPGRLKRQVEVIADSTGIDPHRMLRWTVAWGALSSCWGPSASPSDPASDSPSLRIARLAERLL